MEEKEKKSKLRNLFSAQKKDCCSIEIEEIPEEEQKEVSSSPCCNPEPKNMQDSKKANE
jgi:hypothetical protein